MKKITFLIIVSIIFTLSLAACGTNATQPAGVDSEAFKTLVAGTLTAVAEQIALTPVVTNTLMPTETTAPTATVTLEPTREIISLTVNEVANCRKGPATYYPVIATLNPGAVLEILGKNPTGDWYYVRNPDATGSNCWVSSTVVTVTGSTNALAVFTPQPTPYPTRTPTLPPTADYSVTYIGKTSCAGGTGLNFQISNIGNLKLESIRIRNIDTVTAEKIINQGDAFIYYSGGVETQSQKDLLPGESGVVSTCWSQSFTGDPTGHNVDTKITICTSNGMAGTCTAKDLIVKP